MDESSTQLVSEIGTQLGRLGRPNKDYLVKSLRQAESALSQIEQPSLPEASKKVEAVKRLEVALKPLSKSVIKLGLIRHSDKDIKLLVAICVSEIFRILAPEPPFEDKHLRDIFTLILNMFAELADTSSPYFSRRVKILETVARCKCFVVMLDIECSDLVLEMFKIFFSVVRENHQRSLINDILSIMTHILNEEASQPLSDVILQNLIKDDSAASSAASQLAVSVIQHCAEKLEPFVCGFLTSCSLDRDAVESELKEFYHEILFRVFKCAPDMLLAVIPNLTQELLIDQVDVRIKAINLIGKLLALTEHRVAQKYHNLFIEFKNRFSDKSVEVRLSALQCAKACYMTNPSGKESSELLLAIEGRLLDFDERVRTLAVVVVCDLARFNLKIFPSEVISKVTERLRDKKVSVRKKALQKLMEVYQEYCNKCSQGYLTIGDHFEQIPCKILMLCYDKDCKEFRSQNIELILAESMFPACLSAQDRTRHWIYFFSLFSPLHIKALKAVLSQKQRLQIEMQSYLALQKKLKDNGSEELEKRIKSSFVRMSLFFPDSSTAEEGFHKLNKMKDNKIFKMLELVLVERSITNAHTTRDKFLKMIGDKHSHLEFLELLSSKCSFNIFSSEHVSCILDHLSSSVLENGGLEASSAKLLLAIISIFPSLLRGFEEQFLMLLEKKNTINDVLIEALAKAGPHISVRFSDFYPFLERVCKEGTRIQSKHAVSAIASLAGSSEQLIFSQLCKELVDSLDGGRNIPTILQSLGCIAQQSVSAFEPQYRKINSYIFNRIFQEQSDNFSSSDVASECSHSCKLKIYGLKTLVKSFLPHQGSHVNHQVDELFDVLLKFLQTGDYLNGIISCASDKSHIRLAAAKSILRLSKRWDLHVSPEIFRLTVLVVKDSSSSVGTIFLNKTHKLFREHILPIKYACAFALAASDFCKGLRDTSFKYLEEFVKECSITARSRQTSSVQGGSVTDYPAYIVVFLIHILAHDDNFPPGNSEDEQNYAYFCSPLFSVVQTLLNAHVVNGDMDLVNDAVMCLHSIFRAIKRAEDAVDAAQTPKLHILAEIGMYIANALNHNGISLSRAPGMIFLPSSLYKISSVKKSDEANSGALTQFSFNENFAKRVVHILKSQISMPVSSLPKRGGKCQEDVLQSTKHKTLKLTSTEKTNMSLTETTEGQKSAIQNIRQKCSASELVSLQNEMPGKYASKNPKPIMMTKLSSSCDSANTIPQIKSQVLVQNVERLVPSLKKNRRANSSITTESAKHSTARVNEQCCSKMFSTKSEALIGKRIKLFSPIDRCFCSGTIVDFHSGNNTHKISYDSGDVESLCLDGENWEIICDNSSTVKEMSDDSNKSHSIDWSAKDGATMLSKQSANKENEKVSVMASFPAKRKKLQKLYPDTSTSEVINVNEDAIARRTRRRKA